MKFRRILSTGREMPITALLHTQSEKVSNDRNYFTMLKHGSMQVCIKANYEWDFQIINFTIFADSLYGILDPLSGSSDKKFLLNAFIWVPSDSS
jgi:hypothetical protein